MKTDKELRQLAKRVVNREIFISNQSDVIQMSFLVLALAGPDQIPEDVGAVYEEMSKAGPRSINGYPCFFSCQFLTREETKLVVGYINEFEELMKAWED
jgi:hypothetical protein